MWFYAYWVYHEIKKIQVCVSEIRDMRTNHKRVNRNVVLFCITQTTESHPANCMTIDNIETCLLICSVKRYSALKNNTTLVLSVKYKKVTDISKIYPLKGSDTILNIFVIFTYR